MRTVDENNKTNEQNRNIYVTHVNDPVKSTLELLTYLKPEKALSKNARIRIKPNLVCSTPANHGATTHSEIVEGIIIYFQELGYSNINIIEGSWVGDKTLDAFEVCGYNELSRKYGVALVDTKTDNYVEHEYKGLKMNICKSALDADFLINVPLIKGHCQTKITCALKNLKGIIPDFEKRRYHTLGLHKPIAYLNKVVKQDLIIADAICPDPYFEEGGRPHSFNAIIGAFDPVLIDSFAAGVLGYKPEDIEYINLADAEGIGKKIVSPEQIIQIENGLPINKQFKGFGSIEPQEEKYLKLIDEANACSACYSNLVAALRILHEEGLINNFVEQISIGQLFKGYCGVLGVGNCTSSFESYLPGCPPKTEDILKFLRSKFREASN